MPKYKLRDREDLASLLAKDPLLAKDLPLLKALRRLGAAAGKISTDADAAYYQIQIELDGLRNRILRESKLRGRVERSSDEQAARAAEEKEKLLQHRPWHIIARLVRAKRYQLGIGRRRRSSEQKALERSLKELKLDENDPDVKLGPGDLTPVETRAVQLVRGEKVNARKNPIEVQAVAIATAIEADFSRKRKGGRPAARRHNIVFDETSIQYQLRLTATEVIEAALSTIEDLAGPANSSAPNSAMIASVIAVVKAAGVEPRPMPKRIKAAGVTQKTFDANSCASIVWKVQRRRTKRKILK
jgi:hypothetical protein